jgi:hypothetical protein
MWEGNSCGLEISVAYIDFTSLALVNISNLSYLSCLEFSFKYVDEKTYPNFSHQEIIVGHFKIIVRNSVGSGPH